MAGGQQARLVVVTILNHSHLEFQLGKAEMERDRQEADAESSLPVWWSRETPRQVLRQINHKHSPDGAQLKKLWWCVGGGCKVIWLYQIS